MTVRHHRSPLPRTRVSGVGVAHIALCVCMLVACEQEPPHAGDVEDEGPEPVAVTLWGEHTELFVEFPPLVVGTESRMHAHFTRMADFKPVVEGTIRLALVEGGPDGTAVVEDSADAPVRAGIFTPAITPTAAGAMHLLFELRSPDLEDTHVLPVTVLDALPTDKEPEVGHAEEISFLKEQQWATDFATALVVEGEIPEGIAVNATIRSTAGREVWITAPVDGRIASGKPDHPIAPGRAVASGEILFALTPLPGPGVSREAAGADLVSARTELKLAETEVTRLRPLVKKGAVPAHRLNRAEAAVAVAAARVRAAGAASARVSAALGGRAGRSGAFQLKSPIEGTVVELHVTPGATVRAGDRIARVIDLRRVWIEGRVHEADLPRLHDLSSVLITTEGERESRRVDLGDASAPATLVAVGDVVDPTTRTVSILIEIDNPSRRFKIGGYLQLRLPVGAPERGPVIPRGAIVHDRARPVVFVHVEGESFERRMLVLGPEAEGRVLVRSGLAVGDRVVTRGAYSVLLASRSTGEVAGHAH